MNRETKRLVAKQQAAAERERVRQTNLTGARRAATLEDGPKERRLKRWWRFIKEVRLELKKVSWATRSEIVTYTMVVITTVLIVTAIVFALDNVFGRGVFEVFLS